jgi:hypothetical protein
MRNSSENQVADCRMKENNVPVLNWSRIERSLRQYARRSGSEEECPDLIRKLRDLVLLCGSYTASRKKLIAIGKALLNPNLEIVCSVCLRPRDLRAPENIPELVRHHEQFLAKILSVVGPVPVTILIPIHDCPAFTKEAYDLVRTIGNYMIKNGWVTRVMDDVFPEIRELENYWVRELQDEKTLVRIRAFANARLAVGLYCQRGVDIREDEAENLTRRTSAQYLALGGLVQKRNWLICNHTTLNLSWYGKVGSALLHNPVFLGL